MGKRISSQTRKELLEAMQRRYRESSKMDKTRILDEFVALTGYHRKHAVRLLSQTCDTGAKVVQDGRVRSRRLIVPSAGVNRKVPVFGALDAMTGEVTALVTEKKRSSEFLDFLRWLVEDIYGDREHIYLFLDNCSIHHTKAVREYIDSHKGRLTMIWNATYAPDLNLI